MVDRERDREDGEAQETSHTAVQKFMKKKKKVSETLLYALRNDSSNSKPGNPPEVGQELRQKPFWNRLEDAGSGDAVTSQHDNSPPASLPLSHTTSRWMLSDPARFLAGTVEKIIKRDTVGSLSCIPPRFDPKRIASNDDDALHCIQNFKLSKRALRKALLGFSNELLMG